MPCGTCGSSSTRWRSSRERLPQPRRTAGPVRARRARAGRDGRDAQPSRGLPAVRRRGALADRAARAARPRPGRRRAGRALPGPRARGARPVRARARAVGPAPAALASSGDPRRRGGRAEGTAEVAAIPAGTRVKLHADHLPVMRGRTYELWCVRADGRWINGGSFQARSDGTAAAELTAAVKPGDYHVVVVTRRSVGGDRGAEVMRGK